MVNPLDRLAVPPIFVVGYERSGTTLLFESIESHPHVAGVFESWLFDENLGLGGLFDPRYWDPSIIRKRDEVIGRPMGLRPLMERAELVRDVRALASEWLARALGPDDRFLVEKTPVHLYAAPIIAEVFPGARFVEIVRDGRDVVVSSAAASRGWGKEVGRVPTAVRTADMAREWRISVETGLAHQRRLHDSWLRVQFEDLRNDFTSTLATVFDFCCIPHQAEILETARAATDLGDRPTSEAGFRRAGRVGDWRDRLTLRDAVRFHQAAGEVLASSGYDTGRGWIAAVAAARIRRRLARP